MRNGRANFGIHLYSTGCAVVGDMNCSTPTRSRQTTSSSLLSSSGVSVGVNKQDDHHDPSISNGSSSGGSSFLKEKVATIKPESGNDNNGGGNSRPQDEPLQENGIGTVPSGKYSVEKNKTPLEKLHHEGNDDAVAPELRRSEEMMMMMPGIADGTSTAATTSSRKNVENSGIKLKNQQLSSNSSSESFTLSKSSSAAKLPNSWFSIASSVTTAIVQAIHIGDQVTPFKKEDAALVQAAPSSSSPPSMTKIHPTSSQDSNGQQLHRLDISLANGFPAPRAEKSNSSFDPNGGVKSPNFRETSQPTTTFPRGEDETGNFSEMQGLIGSID